MSNASDFIIENGVLTKYVGPGGDVVIPEGVTEIGNEAFEKCTKLTGVTIPDGVTEICFKAFAGCTKLAQVNLPDSVAAIGLWAFKNCSKLKFLRIPNPLAKIHSAFDSCRSLEYVQSSGEATKMLLRNTSTKLQARLCYGFLSSNDTDAAYEDACKRRKDSLIELIVTDDNAQAMARLFSLFKKKFSVAELDGFIALAQDKPMLSAFLLDYKNKTYPGTASAELNLEAKNETQKKTVAEWKELYSWTSYEGGIQLTGYKGTDTVLEIPEEIGGKKVLSIGEYAFSCYKMQYKKDRKAFFERELKIVHIPAGVIDIDCAAFTGCKHLEAVYVPATVDSIAFIDWSEEMSSFYDCPNLTLHVTKGSYAQKYAKKNKIPFVAEE